MGKGKGKPKKEIRLPIDLHARKVPDSARDPLVPKTEAEDTIYESMHPVWSFAAIDLYDDEYGWRNCHPDYFDRLIEFIQTIEGTTWGQIRSDHRRHHYCPVDVLEFDARMRNRGIERGVIDEEGRLFRFRMAAQERIWGRIRHGVFEPVWWDPHHRIWPVDHP